MKDVHYTPYNLVRFYVGEITTETPQTVKIYTDSSTSVDVQVSEGNKWYTYVLPKDKGLCIIEGDSVKKVVVKANISYKPTSRPPYYYPYLSIIPTSTVEASFKGSNTSNVTSMYSMFNGCTSLSSLDLSGWDTSNVTSMTNMFISCNSLKSLDLSGWNTSKVTDMSSMFSYCSNLTSLDVSNFNTSNVTNMGQMFRECSRLTSLDLSNFDTSKVISMMLMFNDCSNLTSLNLSGWNTSNVTDMGGMFNGCSKLKTIRMVGCEQPTIDKIKAQLTTDGIINNVTIVTA